MIKDLEYLVKKIFINEKYLLKKRLKRAISKKYEKELALVDLFRDKTKEAIDVGVYRGVYSFKMAENFKHVHSFEPNPLLFSYLNKNLSEIIANISLYNYALSNKNEFAKLKIPYRGKSFFKNNIEEIYQLGRGTIHKNNNFQNFNSYEVECKKLDDIIKDKEISFIKIDVEGHELNVIEGALNIIKKCKPSLLIEIEEKHTKKPVIETVKYITNLGYTANYINNNKVEKIINDEVFLKERNFFFLKK